MFLFFNNRTDNRHAMQAKVSKKIYLFVEVATRFGAFFNLQNQEF